MTILWCSVFKIYLVVKRYLKPNHLHVFRLNSFVSSLPTVGKEQSILTIKITSQSFLRIWEGVTLIKSLLLTGMCFWLVNSGSFFYTIDQLKKNRTLYHIVWGVYLSFKHHPFMFLFTLISYITFAYLIFLDLQV